MMSAERSIQWPMTLGTAPASPLNIPQTDADEGAVGQLADDTQEPYHDRASDR